MATEVTTTEQGKPSAIVTIDPQSYVAEVFAPFQKRLDAAVASATSARIITDGGEVLYLGEDGTTHQITTKIGMELAKAKRRILKAIRIDSDKERATRKAPILTIGKLLDSRYKEIEAAVTPLEELFDADITAEEKRIEDEKAAKIKAEAERQAAIQTRLDAIKGAPIKALNMTADEATSMLAELELAQPVKELFGERYVEAELALETSIAQLKAMIEGKRAQEELARHVAEQRAEQERQAAEAARLQAEAEARAKADREAEEAIARAELARQQEEIAAQRAEIARQQAELRKQQEESARLAAELASKEAEATAKADREAAEKMAAEEAERAEAAKPVAEVAQVIEAPAPSNVVNLAPANPVRPSDTQIIMSVAAAFNASNSQAARWIVEVAENMTEEAA